MKRLVPICVFLLAHTLGHADSSVGEIPLPESEAAPAREPAAASGLETKCEDDAKVAEQQVTYLQSQCTTPEDPSCAALEKCREGYNFLISDQCKKPTARIVAAEKIRADSRAIDQKGATQQITSTTKAQNSVAGVAGDQGAAGGTFKTASEGYNSCFAKASVAHIQLKQNKVAENADANLLHCDALFKNVTINNNSVITYQDVSSAANKLSNDCLSDKANSLNVAIGADQGQNTYNKMAGKNGPITTKPFTDRDKIGLGLSGAAVGAMMFPLLGGLMGGDKKSGTVDKGALKAMNAEALGCTDKNKNECLNNPTYKDKNPHWAQEEGNGPCSCVCSSSFTEAYACAGDPSRGVAFSTPDAKNADPSVGGEVKGPTATIPNITQNANLIPSSNDKKKGSNVGGPNSAGGTGGGGGSSGNLSLNPSAGGGPSSGEGKGLSGGASMNTVRERGGSDDDDKSGSGPAAAKYLTGVPKTAKSKEDLARKLATQSQAAKKRIEKIDQDVDCRKAFNADHPRCRSQKVILGDELLK